MTDLHSEHTARGEIERILDKLVGSSRDWRAQDIATVLRLLKSVMAVREAEQITGMRMDEPSSRQHPAHAFILAAHDLSEYADSIVDHALCDYIAAARSRKGGV